MKLSPAQHERLPTSALEVQSLLTDPVASHRNAASTHGGTVRPGTPPPSPPGEPTSAPPVGPSSGSAGDLPTASLLAATREAVWIARPTMTAEIPAGFPTLRIVFEPEDDGESIGRILRAWDRSANAEEDGDATWWPLSVRFARDRISRDELQAEILAAAECSPCP